MNRTENVELTTLCLIHRENQYLLQNRVKNDWKGCIGSCFIRKVFEVETIF